MRKKLLSFDAVGAKRVRCAFQCEVANAAAPAILVGKKSATRSCRNRHAEDVPLTKMLIASKQSSLV
ncbi:MAG: hypothetical protein RR218_10730, partial [Gordonibacter sp.]